jgi:hypothetical protein
MKLWVQTATPHAHTHTHTQICTKYIFIKKVKIFQVDSKIDIWYNYIVVWKCIESTKELNANIQVYSIQIMQKEIIALLKILHCT